MLDRRLDWFARAVAAAFLAAIAFSGTLWLSGRAYPLAPLLPFALPHQLDAALLGLLCCLLAGLITRPRDTRIAASAFLLVSVLFLEDRGRMWPSFYEFWLFLGLLAFRLPDEKRERAVLAAAQAVLALAYFWSGFLKLNPRFYAETFPWFIAPISMRFPPLALHAPDIAVVAAVAEVLFALLLFTRRFRDAALAEATLMHALIFFLIGPLRGNWNDSAWLWSAATCAFLWLLFFRAPAFSIGALRDKGPFTAAALLALLLVGVMPALNLVNRWPSALSFNVYTGNVATGQLLLADATAAPREVAPYVREGAQGGYLDIAAWSAAAFNANPVADIAVYRALLERACSWTSATLIYREKAGWGIPASTATYRCGS